MHKWILAIKKGSLKGTAFFHALGLFCQLLKQTVELLVILRFKQTAELLVILCFKQTAELFVILRFKHAVELSSQLLSELLFQVRFQLFLLFLQACLQLRF